MTTYYHHRFYNELGSVSPVGGVTVGYRLDTKANRVLLAVSACSLKDNFVKATGRKIVDERLDQIEVKNLDYAAESQGERFWASLRAEDVLARYFPSDTFKPGAVDFQGLPVTALSDSLLHTVAVEYADKIAGEL